MKVIQVKTDQINGGNKADFCKGVMAVDLVAGAIIAANLWNPGGWGFWAVTGAANIYCAY